MTHVHRNASKRTPARIGAVASLVCIAAFASPPAVAAQTASPQLCAAAKRFAEADRAVIELATASHERQLAAQTAWHQALEALVPQLPTDDARAAAETLHGAQTVATDKPWTDAQLDAHRLLAKVLAQRCEVELPRR